MTDTPKQDRDRPQADQPSQQQDRDEQGGEETLTEQEERKRGGANKQTPGPIYDV